jgi:hypothetical protein
MAVKSLLADTAILRAPPPPAAPPAQAEPLPSPPPAPAEPSGLPIDLAGLPPINTCFTITFPNQHTAKAARVDQDSETSAILRLLELDGPARPALFISGGAGAMSEDDKARTYHIIEIIGRFAEENNVVVIDGGTESGIMQMIGDVRRKANYTFPLIGVAPLGKVSFPGFKNPNEEAELEDSHTHFVLIDASKWGDESRMLIRLTHAIAGHQQDEHKPTTGILINGGKIALQEVYLASATELKMPMLVLEGSGRAADEISTAFRSGQTKRSILRAILAGGEVSLISIDEGNTAVQTKLNERFSLSR